MQGRPSAKVPRMTDAARPMLIESRRPAILRGFAALAFLATLPFASRLAVGMFEPTLAEAPAGREVLWLNALLVALATALLWAATGKALLAAWASFWLLWTVHALNAIKLEQLHRMLTPGDFALVGQLLTNVGLFSRYLQANAGGALWAACIVLVASLLAWLEPRSLPRWHWRLPLAAFSAIVLGSVLAGHETWRSRLDDARLANFQIWAPDQSLKRSGLLLGLVRLGWERQTFVSAPTPQERQALDAFLAAQQDRLAAFAAVVPPEQPPDLIVIQSEALFDPARLRGIESGEWLGEFRGLRNRGLHGELTVPTYGGGTIRTEFEVLTGYPMAAFPNVDYPYYGLAGGLDALPARLRGMGYRTSVVHPYERGFWNRDAALRKLGFEDAHFEGDRAFRDPLRRGPYIADESAYEAAWTLLSSDRPHFVFVITMENHSPWLRRRNIDRTELDAIEVPANLDAKAREELRTYLVHLRNGDLALGAFARRVLARTRPTLLLVYGDHLPSLSSTYEQLGFDDQRRAWQQTVPYVLAGNIPLPNERRDLHAYQLSPFLMRSAGLPVDGYFGINAALGETDSPCRKAACSNAADLASIAARIDHSQDAGRASGLLH